MNDETTSKEMPKVSCEVCLKEVPKSEARFTEVQDYVLYFCGADCYDRWIKENGEKQEEVDK